MMIYLIIKKTSYILHHCTKHSFDGLPKLCPNPPLKSPSPVSGADSLPSQPLQGHPAPATIFTSTLWLLFPTHSFKIGLQLSLPGTARPDLTTGRRTSTQLHDCLVSTDLSFSLHFSVKRDVPSYRKLTLYLCSGGPRPSRPQPINIPTSPHFPNVFNLFFFSLLSLSKHAQLSHPSQANTKPPLTPCSLVTYPAFSSPSKLNILKPFELPVSTFALCVHHFMKPISSLSEKH